MSYITDPKYLHQQEILYRFFRVYGESWTAKQYRRYQKRINKLNKRY